MRIIVKLMIDAEFKIKIELEKINKDIEDFDKPLQIPSVLEMKKREAYFEERQTGRLSSENLKKNYSRKLELENELQDIQNFKYHHKEWFE